MRGKIAGIGALVSAVFASACCLGPVAWGAGLASGLERFRPVFLGLTAAFLGVAFYRAYGRRTACAEGGCREPGPSASKARVLLWTVAALAAGLATFPSWSSLVTRDHAEACPVRPADCCATSEAK